MARAKAPHDPACAARLASYERLVASLSGVERKGDTVPYTSLNGHMFSALHADGRVALRLPPAAREAFLERYESELFHVYGVVQKEYVTVPDAVLSDTAALAPWFRQGYEYVASLRPKPTKARR